MADEIAYVVLDTNSLLHFARPDQIDWKRLTGSPSVRLVIAPIVLDELEHQKIFNRSRKYRDRADGAIKWLAAFLDSEPGLELKPGIGIEFIRFSPQIDFRAHRLSFEVNDDQLIASALEFQTENTCRVRIFTADTGLRSKLRAHKIDALVPSSELALPEELTDQEKELASANAELARHQNRLPRLSLTFPSGESHFSPTFLTDPISKMQPARQPSRNVYGFPTQSADWHPYLEEFEVWKDSASRSCGFAILLGNQGSAPATNIEIEIRFPELARAIKLDKAPEPPSALNMLDFHSQDLDGFSERDPLYADDHSSVTFSVSNLVQHRSFQSDVIFLRFRRPADFTSFAALYTVTYAEGIERMEGQLHFIAQRER